MKFEFVGIYKKKIINLDKFNGKEKHVYKIWKP